MKKEGPPTQEAFDCLLAFLDPDREVAGEKYEEVRGKLIRMFARRGCPVSEDLADEVIDRVTRKCLEIAPSWKGDPLLYFYGVAKNVYHEYVRRKPPPPPPPPPPPDEKERPDRCLTRCKEQMDASSRKLIEEYFCYDGRAKINHRKQLAEELGVTLNTLRMKAFRIKKDLKKCVVACLDEPEQE